MADTPSRQQLVAAKAVLEPVVRGLDDLAVVSLTAPSLQADQEARSAYKQRRDLIGVLLLAMDDVDAAWAELLADGYPTLPVVLVRGPIYEEFQEELSDINIAVSTAFALRPEAAKIVFGPVTIEDKPIL